MICVKGGFNENLKKNISYKKQQKIIDMFGKVEFDEGYDYKQARKR